MRSYLSRWFQRLNTNNKCIRFIHLNIYFLKFQRPEQYFMLMLMFQRNWKYTIFSVWILNGIKINLFYFFLSLSVSFECFMYEASYNEIKNAKQPSCQRFHCAFWINKNDCISSATTAEQKINRYAQKLGQFNSKSMRFYEFSIVISGILNDELLFGRISLIWIHFYFFGHEFHHFSNF